MGCIVLVVSASGDEYLYSYYHVLHAVQKQDLKTLRYSPKHLLAS